MSEGSENTRLENTRLENVRLENTRLENTRPENTRLENTRVPSPRLRDAWGAFAVALVVRMTIVAWAHGRFPASEDGHYYDVLARRLAGGLGYTWPWPDGTVTYAALYPVGYPALLAVGYALFGASGAVAMTLNALFGAAAAFAMHRLVDTPGTPHTRDAPHARDAPHMPDTARGGRVRPLAAALAVALHPALVPYTAAVMTEGVTASLLVIAAAIAGVPREDRARAFWTRATALGLVMGVATLVRPQSLLLAPVFGAIAARPRADAPTETTAPPASQSRALPSGVRAVLGGLFVVAITLACVLPWTARNCQRMHRCALVSVNGGWNLLIGSTTPNGGWQPVAVPASCATVWDEAGKDTCFERAAIEQIARSPLAWIARAPSKIAMTLDYFGAAPWYLHSSNGAAFGDHAKVALGAAEALASRLFLLGALVACSRLGGSAPFARKIVALLGAAAALTLHGWLGYVAIVACVLLMGARAMAKAPPLVLSTAAVIIATIAVHAVFFGSGRYGLMVAPFVAGVGFVRLRPDFVRPRRTHLRA